MKKSLIALAAAMAIISSGTVRARTTDAAFGFRMGAGFPGDVNRAGVFSVLPGLQNIANPIALYGNSCLIDGATNSYRQVLAADQATLTKIAGVLVRPYPTQQTSGGLSSALGAAVPPVAGVVDICTQGFMMVKCNNFATQQPVKGGAVFVWCTASAGAQVQGGFSSVASAGNTAPVANAFWNGPGDATGVAEIQIFPA